MIAMYVYEFDNNKFFYDKEEISIVKFVVN